MEKKKAYHDKILMRRGGKVRMQRNDTRMISDDGVHGQFMTAFLAHSTGLDGDLETLEVLAKKNKPHFSTAKELSKIVRVFQQHLCMDKRWVRIRHLNLGQRMKNERNSWREKRDREEKRKKKERKENPRKKE